MDYGGDFDCGDCDCGDCDCGDADCGDCDCGDCDCGNEYCCCLCSCGFCGAGNVYLWPICCCDTTSAPEQNNRQAKEITSADSPVVSQPTAQAQYVPYVSDVTILGLPMQEPVKSDDRGLPLSHEEVTKDSKQ